MKPKQFFSLMVLTAALIGSVVFAQQTTKLNSKAAFLKRFSPTREEPLPKGTQGNWYNAGVGCDEYYIGAQNGTTNAEYVIYEYTQEGPGKVLSTQALSLTETQGQYESLFVPWNPALNDLYFGQAKATYESTNGSVKADYDTGVIVLNCLP